MNNIILKEGNVFIYRYIYIYIHQPENQPCRLDNSMEEMLNLLGYQFLVVHKKDHPPI